MHVRFWGTRGSIPTPGHRTAIYGGNTSCVEIRTDDGTTLVLDCGTGIRLLGLDMLRRPGPHRIHLLIGQTHWDHIQGFPFFTPAFLPGSELNIYGSGAFQRSLEDSLSGQMQYSYFPVKLQDLASRIHYTELEDKASRKLRHGQEWPFTDLHTINFIVSRRKGKRKVLVLGFHINFKPLFALRVDHLEGTEFRWIHSLRLTCYGRDDPPNRQRS